MPRQSLASVVADALAAKIRAGELAAGAQLPTEAELCAAYDVSRTVVREAVARLRSEGLVVAERGRGMFVSETPAQKFAIADDELKTLPETIALLELRLSVEVESAGLCAERRSDAEAAAIEALMQEIDARNDDPAAVAIHYDYDFHLAIAAATRNPFIHAFLTYLRPIIVPRYQLGTIVGPAVKDAYYARIHAEHTEITAAIAAQDADGARRAMRRHLAASLERVRALALQAGVGPTETGEGAAAARLFADLIRPLPPD